MYTPVQTNQMPVFEKIRNFAWSMVNLTIFRYLPPFWGFFRKWRVLLLRVFGANVDWNTSIYPKAKIEYPWNLTIGKLSSIGENSWIYAMAPIKIANSTGIKDVESWIVVGGCSAKFLKFSGFNNWEGNFMYLPFYAVDLARKEVA